MTRMNDLPAELVEAPNSALDQNVSRVDGDVIVSEDANPQFAEIPEPATNDTRLTARHWRVLGIISYRERFNTNGRGCYASHHTLADRANVRYRHVP